MHRNLNAPDEHGRRQQPGERGEGSERDAFGHESTLARTFGARARPRTTRSVRRIVVAILSVPAVLALLVAPPPTLAAVGGGVVRQSVMPDGQDVRDRPYFGGKFVGHVDTGDTVEILEEKDGWTRVRGSRAEGWLRSHVLGPVTVSGLREEPPAPRGAPAISHGTADPAPPALPAESLGRPGPSLSEQSRQVILRPGPAPPTQVELPAQAIRVVSPEAIARDDASPFRMPREEVLPGSEIAPARPLHLRSRPDWASQLVGRIPPHEDVIVVEARNDWSLVEAVDGLSGWVRTAALTAPPLTPPWTPPAVQVFAMPR